MHLVEATASIQECLEDVLVAIIFCPFYIHFRVVVSKAQARNMFSGPSHRVLTLLKFRALGWRTLAWSSLCGEPPSLSSQHLLCAQSQSKRHCGHAGGHAALITVERHVEMRLLLCGGVNKTSVQRAFSLCKPFISVFLLFPLTIWRFPVWY